LIMFKDLSVWLKIPIVFSYIFLGIYVLAFLVGFIIGVTE
jgi:hypothetical protein